MDKIEKLFEEWQSLQPLTDENQRRLDQKFMLEFNYNSNHIEGNTLTYGQTEMLLLFGKVVEDANMKDLEEMKASNVGVKMIKAEASDRERPLTEAFIRELHRVLLREDYEEQRHYPDGSVRTYTVHAGIYKTRPNSVKTVTGEIFEYATPEETPSLMTDLVNWYNEEENRQQMSPIALATLFHYRFIRIHPFEDGNGRVCRLLVNYILCRHGYPMLVVKSSDKENYLTALNRCDIAVGPVPSVGAHAQLDQIAPFVDYMKGCLERALTISIKAAKGENIEDDDDFEKQLKLIERAAKKEIPQGEHIVTPQDKMDVFNNFHRPFVSRLLATLKPAFTFFNNTSILWFMTKGNDSINPQNFFKLNENDYLDNNLPSRELNIIDEAQSILFHITLSDVKRDYQMDNTQIYIKASVLFDNTYYTFNGIKYPYGSYPTPNQLNEAIKNIKNNVLRQISKASNMD